MNSSEPLSMAPMSRQQTRRASSWIELVVLPIAVSCMEALPVALALAFGATFFTGGTAAAPLQGGWSVCLELGLLWWFLLAARLPLAEHLKVMVSFVGAGVACLLVVGSYFPMLIQGQRWFAAFLAVGVVLWFGLRGMGYIRTHFRHSSLIASFRINLGVVVCTVLGGLFLPDRQSLLSRIPISVLLFFLGSMLALSLSRLTTIRAVQRRRGIRTHSTRLWLFAFAMLTGSMLLFALLIGTIFSPTLSAWIFGILGQIWSIVVFVLEGILTVLAIIIFGPISALFAWIGGLFPDNEIPLKKNKPVEAHVPKDANNADPSVFVAILHWVLLILISVLLFLVLRHFWRVLMRSVRRSQPDREDVDETRELLERMPFRQRWQGWRRRRSVERLAPDSIRALYRKLLQGLAVSQAQLERAIAETPAEYQARLLTVLQANKRATGPLHPRTDLEVDRQYLDELTQLYILERYGGRPVASHQQNPLRAWLPGFIKRMVKRRSA